MEVVNHSTTIDTTRNATPNEEIYPVKTKLVHRISEQTERTERCSDFSDFSPDAFLGEIGFAYKDNNNDSSRTRSTVNVDDSFRTREDSYRTTRSSRLSFSGRYDYDLQTENEELKLELINTQAERDDLKAQISIMSWEMAQLRERLKMRENQLVKQELVHTAAKRASFESEKSTSAPNTPSGRRRSLLGRGSSLRGLFGRSNSSKRSLTDEEEQQQQLPLEVSVPTATSPAAASSPKKNRRSMLKRIFSGKGKDLNKSTIVQVSSEPVLDEIPTTKPQQEQQKDETIHYIDWHRDAVAQREAQSSYSRVTMAGFKKERPIHVLHWSRDPIIHEEDEVSISGDSEMDSTCRQQITEEEYVQILDWKRSEQPTTPLGTIVSAKQEKEEEPVHIVQWYREAPAMPVLNIKWERVPATPVLNIKWERIPSTRNLAAAAAEKEEGAPVQQVQWYRVPATPVINIKWERIPSSRNLAAAAENKAGEPVLNIKWERIPSKRNLAVEKEGEAVHEVQWIRVPATPVINIQWERIPSSRNLAAEKKEGEPIHEVHWYRVPATPVLNIQWERIPSARKLVKQEEEPVHEIVWCREPATPILNIKWERIPATREIFTIKEERASLIKKEQEEQLDTPVLDIRWERLPSEPVMNIQWKRVPSFTAPAPAAAESDEKAAEYEAYLRNSFSFSGKDCYESSDDEDLDLAVVESLAGAAAAATRELVQMDWAEPDNVLVSPKPLKSALKKPGSSSSNKPKKSAGFADELEEDASSSPKKRGVMIRESFNEVNRVSMIRGSAWDNCFFTEDEMADFKYKAFLEECGLTEDDF